MAAALLMVGLTACGGSAIGGSSILSDYCDVVAENIDSEGPMGDEFIDELNQKFLGKTITTDIDGEVDFTIKTPFTIKDFDVQEGTIVLDAMLEFSSPIAGSLYNIVGMKNDTAVKHLKYTIPTNTPDGYHVEVTLNVARALKQGDEAIQRIRDINRIVFLGTGSHLDENLKDYMFISELKDNGVFGRFPVFADDFAKRMHDAQTSQYRDLEMELRDSLKAITPTIVGNTIPTETTQEAGVRVIEPFTVIDIKIPEGSKSESAFNNQYAFVKMKANIDVKSWVSGAMATGFISETPIFNFSGHLIDGVWNKPKDGEELGDYVITIYVHPYQVGKAISGLDRIVFTREKDLKGYHVFELYGRKGFGGDMSKTFNNTNMKIL